MRVLRIKMAFFEQANLITPRMRKSSDNRNRTALPVKAYPWAVCSINWFFNWLNSPILKLFFPAFFFAFHGILIWITMQHMVQRWNKRSTWIQSRLQLSTDITKIKRFVKQMPSICIHYFFPIFWIDCGCIF